MNRAEAIEIRRVLALLNEARKERDLGNTEAMALESEARAILARLLEAQEAEGG